VLTAGEPLDTSPGALTSIFVLSVSKVAFQAFPFDTTQVSAQAIVTVKFNP